MSETIRVGLVTDGFFFTPFYAGVDLGFFEQAGLQVENVVLGGIDQVTSALKSGEIQVGVGSPEHVIIDVEGGGDLRMIAGALNKLTHSLIVQPEITSLRDLRGKVLGVSALSAGTSSLFRSILSDVGLNYPGDYEIVEAGAVPPRHEKLLAREIDAAMQTDPHNYLAEDIGLGNLGLLANWIPFFNFTSVHVDRNWASAHEREVIDLLKAVLRTSEWMYENKAAAVDVAAAHMDIERRYIERAWSDYTTLEAVPRDLRLLRPSIQTALDIMREYRSEDSSIDPTSTVERYVDTHYLEQAQREFGIDVAALV